jgi:hypothetical protein
MQLSAQSQESEHDHFSGQEEVEKSQCDDYFSIHELQYTGGKQIRPSIVPPLIFEKPMKKRPQSSNDYHNLSRS